MRKPWSRTWLALAVLAALAGATRIGLAQGADASGGVPYPEGYRDFTHVKSMVIEEGHPLFGAFGGIHHVYANEAALRGLRAGGRFDDGAVLVFDLLGAKREASAISEGGRKVVGVMHKDRQRFAATGGWGFEGFKGDTRERAVSDAGAQCFACHESRKAQDFVFSAWRE
jgi:hypothetical protein